MDRAESGDPRLLKTYEYLGTVNAVARWGEVYRRYIRPLAKRIRAAEGRVGEQLRPIRVLDIGCGAGDVLSLIARYLSRDGFVVEGVGVDLEPSAIELARGRHPTFKFHAVDAATLPQKSFDVVLSCHVVHHLAEEGLGAFLSAAEKLAKHLVLFNDIERSAVAYYMFKGVTAPFFPNSFIRPDGLTSIRRSYKKGELERLIPGQWRVERLFPYRLLLLWEVRSIDVSPPLVPPPRSLDDLC